MLKVIGEQPWSELEARIRAVHLLRPRNGELIYPYENAEITLAEIPYNSVRPTSLYVLRSNLEHQRIIAEGLALQGKNPLILKGMLTIQLENSEPQGLIPPIVEETDEDGRYVLDGLHRSYLGWQAGKLAFTAVHIQGIRPDCPAAARPNSWEEVVEYESVPTDISLKRRYRIDDYLSLRRDFSALNGSVPRY